VPAFLLDGGTSLELELLTAAAKPQKKQNNPLMVCRRHWKSALVLPTFQLSHIGAPALPAMRPTSCVSRAWIYRYG
jgi:hypothetical protein